MSWKTYSDQLFKFNIALKQVLLIQSIYCVFSVSGAISKQTEATFNEGEHIVNL